MTCNCGTPAIYTEYGKWFCLACWFARDETKEMHDMYVPPIPFTKRDAVEILQMWRKKKTKDSA